MTKFLKWAYLTDNGLVTQSAMLGMAFSVASVISNQKFDINAGFWAILPLLAVCHFASKQLAGRKNLAIVRTFR